MVVAGNSGVHRFAARLRKFLEHPDDVVRSHAKWAIEKLERSTKPNTEEVPKLPS
jgi:hypothetical protein